MKNEKQDPSKVNPLRRFGNAALVILNGVFGKNSSLNEYPVSEYVYFARPTTPQPIAPKTQQVVLSQAPQPIAPKTQQDISPQSPDDVIRFGGFGNCC